MGLSDGYRRVKLVPCAVLQADREWLRLYSDWMVHQMSEARRIYKQPNEPLTIQNKQTQNKAARWRQMRKKRHANNHNNKCGRKEGIFSIDQSTRQDGNVHSKLKALRKHITTIVSRTK